MKVAIQGIRGSFHDIAAHQYFSDTDIELVCCNSFEQVFDTMKADDTCTGLIAIENTIAGSLLHNYELLRESGVESTSCTSSTPSCAYRAIRCKISSRSTHTLLP